MQKPLVSVVTPSYNSVKLIENTILTIKHQSYPFVEHIIVDGGSTDGTIDTIRRYERSYNLRWISEPDGGMYDALNKGFRMACGDIFSELDCDDLYLPWSVDKAVQALEKKHLIYGDSLSIDCDRLLVSLEGRPAFLSSYYRAAGTISQPTVFWRREVWEKIGGFDQHFKLLGDVEYWLRADAAGFKPYKIPEIMAVARRRRTSQSHSSENKELLEREFREIREKYSNAIARLLWGCVPLSPFVRRIQMARYWAGSKSLWPAFRASEAVSVGWRDLINSMAFRTRRLSLQVKWSKLLPPGVQPI